MTFHVLFILLALGFCCTIVFTSLLIQYCHKRGVLAHPNNRTMHARGTPNIGGVGIWATVLIAWALLLSKDMIPANPMTIGIPALALFLAIIGLIDDIRGLRAITRLLIQVFIAILSIIIIFKPTLLDLTNATWLDYAYIGFAFFWILACINLYNFMDGIDGMAGTQALLASLSWMLFGLIFHIKVVIIFSALISSSSLAFLFFNWNPAKVFMGDNGSTFLGYIFGVLPLMCIALPPVNSDIPAIAAGVLFIWPFLYDAGLTVLKRIVRRENVFLPHRKHYFQRLVLSGFDHSTITLTYALLALIGSLALFLNNFNKVRGLSIASMVILLAAMSILALTYHTEGKLKLKRSKRSPKR